jgi:YVTN family beta-propeller protein
VGRRLPESRWQGSRANRIAVVDVATAQVLRFILVGQRPWQIALSPDGGLLYSVNGLTNDVTVIDTASQKPLTSVPIGRLPWGTAVKP